MNATLDRYHHAFIWVVTLSLSIIALLALVPAALATETAPQSAAPLHQIGITFTSVQNGDWDNPATWDQNTVPSLNDAVVIANGTTVVIPDFLSVTRDADTTINAGGTLGNIGGTVINDGTLNSDGILASNGPFTNNGTIINTGFLEVSGNTLTNNSTLTNSGTLNSIMGGTINNAGTLENTCNGRITGANPTGNPVQQQSPCTFTSVATGNWDNPATWDLPRTPTAVDTVTIANGTTVTIPSGLSVTRDAATVINVGGTLTNSGTLTNNNQFENDSTLNNDCGGVINQNGTYSGNAVIEGCTVTVVLDDLGDTDTTVDFTSDLPGNASFTLQDSSNTTLAAGNPGTGTYTISATLPAGFIIGDITITGDTNSTGSSTDTSTVQAIVGVEEGENITVTFVVVTPTITVTETNAGSPLEEGGGSYPIQLLFSVPTTAALEIVVDLSDQCFHSGLAPGEPLRIDFTIGGDNVTFFPRAVDDMLVESSQSCDIDIRIENSSDPNYPDQVLADVTVPIIDNEASVTIVKDDISDSDTIFDFTTDLGNPASFTLQDPSNTSTTYVVSAGTYTITEADETGFYQASATCDNGDTPDAVTVDAGDTVTCTFVNNTLGGTPSLLSPIPTATESGTPGLVGVGFNPATTAALDLVFDPDEQCFFNGLAAGEARVEPTTPMLDALVVTVFAVDDTVAEGDHSCEVAISIANSNDPVYENGLIGTVTINIIDNDAAGVSVIPSTPQQTSEAGGTIDYSVVLTSAPSANVTVTFTSSDTTEGNVTAGGILTFTDANWDSPQTVTVAGVDDELADGDINYSLSYLSSSMDSDYDALAGVRQLENLDNDAADVLVTPTTLQQTSERGTTVAYSVVLTSEPTDDVTITFTSSDTTEGTVDGPLVFTAANWDTPQSVTVTGADDALLDGDIAYSLSYLSRSTDPNYDTVAGVRLLENLDNDVAAGDAALLIAPTTLLVAEDAPGSNSFTVALGQAPASGEIVTVTFGYNDRQLALSPNSVQFDSSNFNQPITISVDAVADGVEEDILPYNITVTTSSNLGNTALNGLTGTVMVTIFDNADLIIVFVPNIGTLTVFASSPTQVYEAAKGGVLRDSATTAEVFLPRDADGNGFDTYTITDYNVSGEDVWLAVWLGSANWGWVQYNADTMLLEGDIWEMLYNAQN